MEAATMGRKTGLEPGEDSCVSSMIGVWLGAQGTHSIENLATLSYRPRGCIPNHEGFP